MTYVVDEPGHARREVEVVDVNPFQVRRGRLVGAAILVLCVAVVMLSYWMMQ